MAMQADTMSFFLPLQIRKTFPQQPANIIPTSNMRELEIQMQLIYLFQLFPKQSIVVQSGKWISISGMLSELMLPNIRFRISVSALLSENFWYADKKRYPENSRFYILPLLFCNLSHYPLFFPVVH